MYKCNDTRSEPHRSSKLGFYCTAIERKMASLRWNLAVMATLCVIGAIGNFAHVQIQQKKNIFINCKRLFSEILSNRILKIAKSYEIEEKKDQIRMEFVVIF